MQAAWGICGEKMVKKKGKLALNVKWMVSGTFYHGYDALGGQFVDLWGFERVIPWEIGTSVSQEVYKIRQ